MKVPSEENIRDFDVVVLDVEVDGGSDEQAAETVWKDTCILTKGDLQDVVTF